MVRTAEELEEAFYAVQKEFIVASPSPLMIHYIVILDGLRELIYIRRGLEKGD